MPRGMMGCESQFGPGDGAKAPGPVEGRDETAGEGFFLPPVALKRLAGMLGPGTCFIAKSLAIGMGLFGMNLVRVLLMRYVFNGGTAPGDHGLDLDYGGIFVAVVFSPMVETGVMALIYLAVCQWWRRSVEVFVVAVLVFAVASHLSMYSDQTPVVVGFTVFSYQFAAFIGAQSAWRAFLGVAISHGVNNAAMWAFMLIYQSFMRV